MVFDIFRIPFWLNVFIVNRYIVRFIYSDLPKFPQSLALSCRSQFVVRRNGHAKSNRFRSLCIFLMLRLMWLLNLLIQFFTCLSETDNCFWLIIECLLFFELIIYCTYIYKAFWAANKSVKFLPIYLLSLLNLSAPSASIGITRVKRDICINIFILQMLWSFFH